MKEGELEVLRELIHDLPKEVKVGTHDPRMVEVDLTVWRLSLLLLQALFHNTSYLNSR